MGCCLGSALCCAGSCLCSALCFPCKKAGVAAHNYSKVGYTFFQIMFMGVAMIFFALTGRIWDLTQISE